MSIEQINRVETYQLSDDDRLLTEVDHLLRHRTGVGQFDPTALVDIHQNLVTSIQEQAMPSAVTETRHDVIQDPVSKEKIFMWMGKTAVQNAMSGYAYHRHSAALKRVDVEVEEARYASTLEEGSVRVFISPRMSERDAPYDVAKSEHVGDDDAVRVSWIETDAQTGKQQRVMQSLLVKDVPLEAWVRMLEDDSSIFGSSISVEDRASALSVMKTHKELELPVGVLTHGPVSIVEAVLPYITDASTRRHVNDQVHRYKYRDQNQMRVDAEAKAHEWIKFEQELAESLYQERATQAIRNFVSSINHWGEQDRRIIQSHMEHGVLKMGRKLAAILESAQQRVLAGRAALLADEEFVLKQVNNITVLRKMQFDERQLVAAQYQGMNFYALQLKQNRVMAENNIKSGGGGCPGSNRTEFKKSNAFTEDILGLLQVDIDGHKHEEAGSDTDDLGDRNFQCTKGHWNWRRVRNVPEKVCKVCNEDASCKPAETIEAEQKTKKAKQVASLTGFMALWSGDKVKNEQFAIA